MKNKKHFNIPSNNTTIKIIPQITQRYYHYHFLQTSYKNFNQNKKVAELKIIKEFEDIKFISKLYPNNHHNYRWFWGLSTKGGLYAKFQMNEVVLDGWKPYPRIDSKGLEFFSIMDMKIIADKFAKLIPFI